MECYFMRGLQMTKTVKALIQHAAGEDYSMRIYVKLKSSKRLKKLESRRIDI